MKENLFVDLTWLKGTVRAVVSEAIQQKAIENGWRWYVKKAWNDDGYLILCADGCLDSLSDERGKAVLEHKSSLHELSVNDALNGNYGVVLKKPVVKAGDVVFSKGRFHIVEGTRAYNDDDVYVELKGAWTCDYKRCRERRHFKFRQGQRICWPEANAYCTFLRYVSTTAECYNSQHCLVNVDINHFVPASLKERYEVVK